AAAVQEAVPCRVACRIRVADDLAEVIDARCSAFVPAQSAQVRHAPSVKEGMAGKVLPRYLAIVIQGGGRPDAAQVSQNASRVQECVIVRVADNLAIAVNAGCHAETTAGDSTQICNRINGLSKGAGCHDGHEGREKYGGDATIEPGLYWGCCFHSFELFHK